MSIDSAMDSLSTTSDHSVASSNESMSNRHRSRSPPDDRHSIERNGHNLSMNKRTPTPGSPTRHHHRPNNSSPLTSSGAHMMPMPHPLSPPTVSTPNNMSLGGMPPRIVQSLSHLPPHGLGLLNSLQMMHHASPLDLMAVAHHHGPPRSYNSPPPISSSDPTANECKLVDYRGQKVAAFMIQGETMLCLPQAFELFLKHLVGGLHTVYTKLKRLDIVPLVCNVEQVRILRGLGAIQPGVNRCKLLACKDFDVLYRDCTTARCLSIKPPERYKKFYLTKAIKAKYFTKKSSYMSTFTSRPGRPPKRGPVGLSLPPSNYSHPSQMTKKHRLDNGDYGSYENGHLNEISRMDKSPLLANGYNAPPTHLNHIPAFMQMNHHPGNPAHALMSPGMPPHGIPRPDGSIIKGQNLPPAIEAMARTGMWENCRAAYEDIVKHLERLRDERGDDRIEREQKCRDRDSHSRNGSSNGHSPVLNLSKSNVDQHSAGEHSDRSEVHTPDMSAHGGDRDDDNISEVNDAFEGDERHEDKDEELSDAEHETATPPPPSNATMGEIESRHSALNYAQLASNAAQNAASDPNCSSTETLLRNIQGLLKVAADNARQQERQISYEKAELKMDVLREREFKDSLERQLTEERKLRGLYQKRCKREKRNTCRLREQLEHEIKKRNQIEEALKTSGASAEILRIIAENSNNEHRERSTSVTATDRETRSSSSSSKQQQQQSREETNSSKSEHNNNEPKSAESSTSRSRPSSRGTTQQQSNNSNTASNNGSTPTSDNKQGSNWNYPGLQDVMASGAFWQNYSESLAQDLERKARQRENTEETGDSPVKSSLSDRSSYYKNSVLYSSAT